MKYAIRTAAAGMLAAAVMAAPCVSAAAAAGANAAKEAQDRAEISALMWSYSRALDTLNPEAYAANYTPDGAFGKTQGREALRKMIADLKTAQADREAKGGPKAAPMFHVETNEHVEFTGPDSARLHYYWMTLFGGTPGAAQGTPAAAPRVAAVGHGVDDLVRVHGRWLIKYRNVTATDE
jgi:hypothetical protein